MEDNDYLLNDDDDDSVETDIGVSDIEPDKDEFELDAKSEEDDSSDPNSSIITKYEKQLMLSYEDVTGAASMYDALNTIVSANPIHTNSEVISKITKDLLGRQGKNTVVMTDVRSGLLDSYDDDDDDYDEINLRREEETKDLIWRFVKYLAERDLSKDSVTNRKRKQRHIPALIIYLFVNKMYGLIIGCPYLPEEYQDQIRNALEKLNERKYELVDELADALEEVGNKKLADKVRYMRLSFLEKEPAKLKLSSDLRDINIRDIDIRICKLYRSKYVSVSKSITREVASDLFEVVTDKEAGTFEKLKDKVRSEAIEEVKALLRKFAEESVTSDKDNEIAIDILLKNRI